MKNLQIVRRRNAGMKKCLGKLRIDSGEQFLDSNVCLLPMNCQKEMPRQNTKKISPPPWCFVPCLTLPEHSYSPSQKETIVFLPSIFRCKPWVPERLFSPASFPANVEWPTRTSRSIAAWVQEQLGKSQRCQSWPWYSSTITTKPPVGQPQVVV